VEIESYARIGVLNRKTERLSPMKHSSSLYCFLLAGLFSACTAQEPPIPGYEGPIVVEGEPRLSANAEVVDVTGDGLNDIILAIGRHWPGPNLLFTGDGQGGFTAVDTLSFPQDRSYSVSAVDLDADGDIDLVVSNDRPDPKYVLLNDGSGDFSNRVEFGDPMWPTRNITVSDLNADGLPDIVVANRSDAPEGDNWVCMNTSSTAFAVACAALSSGSATTIAVADMNADGFPDLIIPYRDLGQSHVYVGDGTGAFEKGPSFGPADASFRATEAVDLNHDGLLDLVAIDDRKPYTMAFYQTDTFKFDEGHQLDAGEIVPYALYVADLDVNGTKDVIVGYRDAPSILYFNRKEGLVQVAIGDSLGATYGFGVGDVNHDGVPDIVVARSAASDVLFLGNMGHE